MTATSGPWNADMVSRHPQSASNMIGKLETDVARLKRELQEAVMLTLTYQTQAEEAWDKADARAERWKRAQVDTLARANRAEAALARVTDDSMAERIANAMDAAHTAEEEYFHAPEAVLAAIRAVAAGEQTEGRHYSDSLSEGGAHDGPGWAETEGDDRG